MIPARVFVDTNVYIVGVADATSSEWEILSWLGFEPIARMHQRLSFLRLSLNKFCGLVNDSKTRIEQVAS